jgi:Leucine-rich repeat (LRR) protein
MTIYITSIPREVLYLVANYLLVYEEQSKQIFRFNADWRNFMNCSKSHFGDWKKHTQVVVLPMLYADKFQKSSKFRERILQTIANPLLQLELNFVSWNLNITPIGVDGEFKSLNFQSSYINRFPVVSDELFLQECIVESFRSCPTVRKLTIQDVGSTTLDVSSLTIREAAEFSSMNLLNYHTLSHLKNISISCCDSIADVSCFQNVKKLRFHKCPNIIDVSCLSKVYELELSSCLGITDVSSLGGVYNLNLSYSANITDVSALGNVHTLDLRCCGRLVDVSALHHVMELKMEDFDGGDFSGLEKVERLQLIYSVASDITMLKNLKELSLYQCRNTTHFHGLTNLRALTIGYIDDRRKQGLPFTIASGLEIFHELLSLTATSVRFEEQEQEQEGEQANNSAAKLSFRHLQSLQSLSLKYCQFFRIPKTTLTTLRSLQIYGCDYFEELPQDLPFLRELSISYCPKLVVLELSSGMASSTLYPVYSVEVSKCFGLRTVLVNRKVSRMIINGCRRLAQLTVNESIGYLETDLFPVFPLIDGSASVSYYNQGKKAEQTYLSNHYQDD